MAARFLYFVPNALGFMHPCPPRACRVHKAKGEQKGLQTVYLECASFMPINPHPIYLGLDLVLLSTATYLTHH